MKKALIFFALLCITQFVIAQKSNPIVIYNGGVEVFSASEDTVRIGGIMPITMDHINYYTHQYDSLTGVHYFGFAYETKEGCGRFDQEFSLWITEDMMYYYAYTDLCEGFSLWKGHSSLAEDFRSENLLLKHDFNNRK